MWEEYVVDRILLHEHPDLLQVPAPLRSLASSGSRFTCEFPGVLEVPAFRRLGMKKLPSLRKTQRGSLNDEEIQWLLLVHEWEDAIKWSNSQGWASSILPAFPRLDFNRAFRLGQVVTEDAEVPLPPQWVGGTLVQPPPHRFSAEFHRALVHHFNVATADRVAGYLLAKRNEFLSSGTTVVGKTTVPAILWDSVRDQPMTRNQKVALIVDSTGITRRQLFERIAAAQLHSESYAEDMTPALLLA